MYRKLSLLLVLPAVLLLQGCANIAPNVHSAKEAEGKKILAGRFMCYENDEPTRVSKFSIYFSKQGGDKVYRFDPDDDGYFYVAVPEGQYNVNHVAWRNFHFAYRLAFLVAAPEDSVVNFGTIEIRLDSTRVHLNSGIAHIEGGAISDWDVTRPRIAELVGTFGGPIKDKKAVLPKSSNP